MKEELKLPRGIPSSREAGKYMAGEILQRIHSHNQQRKDKIRAEAFEEVAEAIAKLTPYPSMGHQRQRGYNEAINTATEIVRALAKGDASSPPQEQGE